MIKKVPMAIKLEGGGGEGLNGLAISGETFIICGFPMHIEKLFLSYPRLSYFL